MTHEFFIWITLLKSRLYIIGSVHRFVLDGETDEARLNLIRHLRFISSLKLGPTSSYDFWSMYRELLEVGANLIAQGRDPWDLCFYHYPFRHDSATTPEEIIALRIFVNTGEFPDRDQQQPPLPLLPAVERLLLTTNSARDIAMFSASIATICEIADSVESNQLH